MRRSSARLAGRPSPRQRPTPPADHSGHSTGPERREAHALPDVPWARPPGAGRQYVGTGRRAVARRERRTSSWRPGARLCGHSRVPVIAPATASVVSRPAVPAVSKRVRCSRNHPTAGSNSAFAPVPVRPGPRAQPLDQLVPDFGEVPPAPCSPPDHSYGTSRRHRGRCLPTPGEVERERRRYVYSRSQQRSWSPPAASTWASTRQPTSPPALPSAPRPPSLSSPPTSDTACGPADTTPRLRPPPRISDRTSTPPAGPYGSGRPRHTGIRQNGNPKRRRLRNRSTGAMWRYVPGRLVPA